MVILFSIAPPPALTSLSKKGGGHGHPPLPLSRERVREECGHGHPLLFIIRVEVRWFIFNPFPSQGCRWVGHGLLPLPL